MTSANNGSKSKEALIFLHIPKTAGTTLNRIIEWQYSPVSIFTIDPHRFRATAERLRTFSEERRRKIQVVRGHILYGIHEALPQGATYITMLRDPVARFLSSYSFILRRPLHPLHQKLKQEGVGMRDFLELTRHRQNLQTRFISGIGEDCPCEVEHLEKAKDHLRQNFSVVGICERFQESLALLALTFNWTIPYYENRKVSKNRPPIDPALLQRIREENQLDLDLYEFARERFEETLRQEQSRLQPILTEIGSSKKKPGAVGGFLHSSLSAGRFMVSKIASAI